MGSSVTTRRKSWGKIPILRSYLKFRGQNVGYLSLIFLEAKFGAPTRISEANFAAKPPPPDLLIWKYLPPGCSCGSKGRTQRSWPLFSFFERQSFHTHLITRGKPAWNVNSMIYLMDMCGHRLLDNIATFIA